MKIVSLASFLSFLCLLCDSTVSCLREEKRGPKETAEQEALWKKYQKHEKPATPRRKLQGAIENHGDYLILNTGVSDSYWTTTNRTRYYCTFRNLWTPTRHPKDYPELARWSPASVYSHTMTYLPWKVGGRTSMGIEEIVENGYTERFQEEIEVAADQVLDYESSGGTGFYTRQTDFVHIEGIDVDYAYPYMSSVAAMQPTPDWFTGFYDFFVIDDYQKVFFDRFIIQTYPLDGGTDKADLYDVEHDFQDPPKSVERITWASAPNGIYINKENNDVLPVGEWDCLFHEGDEPLQRPDCDFLKFPNCNNPDCGDNCFDCDGTLGGVYVHGSCDVELMAESGGVVVAAKYAATMTAALMTMLGFLML